LVPGEDLLDDDIEGRFSGRRRYLRPLLCGEVLQPPTISLGIEQSIDMIEPDAMQSVRRDQPADEAMRDLEQRRGIHPDAGKIVDIEEPTVVDLVGRDAPEGQAISLAFEQTVELVEALRVAMPAVESLYRGLDEPVGGHVAPA